MAPERTLTLRTWLQAPYNRLGFRRVREVVPTAVIPRDGRAVTPLPAAPRDLDGLRVGGSGGAATTLRSLLDETYTDGLLVMRRGVVVYERYLGGLEPGETHLLMSVSKSFCGALLGVLAGRGLVDPDTLVTDHAPDLAGASLDGATVRHLVDMTAGTWAPEDYATYDDPDGTSPIVVYEKQAGYRPLDGLPALGILGHLGTLRQSRPHGEGFEYRSVLTNALARVLESAADVPYPALLAREVWAPLGPERDAEILLDPFGFPAAEGGMCCTLRDLARFGVAYLRDGRVGDAQVLPAAWVADTRRGDDAALARFASSPSGAWCPGGLYRNGFWVLARDRRFAGLGIHGQVVLVDRDRELVLARLASEPEADHPERLGLLLAALDELDAACG